MFVIYYIQTFVCVKAKGEKMRSSAENIIKKSDVMKTGRGQNLTVKGEVISFPSSVKTEQCQERQSMKEYVINSNLYNTIRFGTSKGMPSLGFTKGEGFVAYTGIILISFLCIFFGVE